jgi:hypothetical protein
LVPPGVVSCDELFEAGQFASFTHMAHWRRRGIGDDGT